MNESEIFLAVVQTEEPQLRDAFLDSVCQPNSELRQKILKKLDNYGKWIGAWDGFSSNLGDTHFIVSENVSGQSLRSLINVEMTLDKKLDLGIQIAEALNAAHSASIVHRDIKPENIMVRPDGLVKVLDFGIAKFYSPSQFAVGQFGSEYKTDPGIIMGTIRYMSPEQARRLSIDFRADLFSFGVVMFEFLTGMLPFHSKNEMEILTSLISDEPLQLKALSQISQYDLELCIKKLLRKDPEERYQSAKELLVDLKQARRQL